MSTINGVWSDEYQCSGWIVWLLNSNEFGLRNMGSIVVFESFTLSEYLVGIWLVDLYKHKSIESAMSVRRSL